MRFLSIFAFLAFAINLPADDTKKPDKGDAVKVSEAGKYEVEFPGKPNEKDTKGGKQYVLQRTDPRVVFISVASPLPKKADLGDADAVKKVFEAASSNTAKSLGGKVLSEREFKLNDKYPARDVDVDAPGIGVFRSRMVLTPGTYVQATVAGPKDVVDGAEAKRFLDSLKIKE
jgi:hypothetical protein